MQVSRAFPEAILVHPGKDPINRREIVIDGHAWTNKNIHSNISEQNYLKPDYSFISGQHPLHCKEPIAVINNKCVRQWPDTFDRPINYFDRPALENLRDLLTRKGYGVVYNHFVEPTKHDQYLDLNDHGIFGQSDSTFDMRCLYKSCSNPAERNKLQLALYNASKIVIGPQGGNMYLPAICRRQLFILMRAGDYIDYCELARLYDIDVEVFYEPRHMLCWLDSHLQPTV
jgi:hypothetical protein